MRILLLVLFLIIECLLMLAFFPLGFIGCWAEWGYKAGREYAEQLSDKFKTERKEFLNRKP